MAYKVISFEEFKGDCRHLAAIIWGGGLPSKLFGIMRGGMIVALYVAHELGIEADSVYPLYPTRRGNDQVCAPVWCPRGTDIIIDDILDTGKTEEDLRSSWPGLQLAVLYCKNGNLASTKNIIVGRYIETKDYLILPHEVTPDEVERL